MANYTEQIPDFGDLLTTEEFKSAVASGGFVDYDGFACPVKDNLMDGQKEIYPSMIETLPINATHVVWFNR